jgi:hypothetical protein
MDLSADLPSLYFDFGETVTVDGADITAIFDTGYAETLEAAGSGPSLRCVSADVATVATGDAATVRAIAYTVRGIEPIGPDGLETRLILERNA